MKIENNENIINGKRKKWIWKVYFVLREAVRYIHQHTHTHTTWQKEIVIYKLVFTCVAFLYNIYKIGIGEYDAIIERPFFVNNK